MCVGLRVYFTGNRQSAGPVGHFPVFFLPPVHIVESLGKVLFRLG